VNVPVTKAQFEDEVIYKGLDFAAEKLKPVTGPL
jgi:hypothetical protein